MSEITNDRPVALITGASAGIGATFARKLAARGCDVILVARRAEKLRELAAEIEKSHGVAAEVLQADLADDAQRETVAERIASCRLEYLVNNAGFGTLGLFAEADLAGQDTMARLHVLTPMRLTHAALPGMIERSCGNIINVASVASFFQSPSNVMYCSTKTWLKSFSDGLAVELEGTGVRVQALCPGFTYSEFHDVMGVDRETVSKKMWLSAEFVVDESLRTLDSGNYLCVPSWRYKLIVKASRFLPRRLRNYIAGRRHKQAEDKGLQSMM